MRRWERKLGWLAQQPGVVSADFDGLNDERVSRRLFEHLLDEPFDREWWTEMSAKHVTIDMAARVQRVKELDAEGAKFLLSLMEMG